ncbi:hypothetical protein ABEB36_013684 [Hypothenemus hampei]|uniref:Uncharacterized protein n=1 Tax=Hypothenemus hampei TaxID=57062 RepID=A0ABD1E555_HYPHA
MSNIFSRKHTKCYPRCVEQESYGPIEKQKILTASPKQKKIAYKIDTVHVYADMFYIKTYGLQSNCPHLPHKRNTVSKCQTSQKGGRLVDKKRSGRRLKLTPEEKESWRPDI